MSNRSSFYSINCSLRYVALLMLLGLNGSAITEGSILDGDPVTKDGVYSQVELDGLGADLFMLAAAVKGYAGGDTGVCIDFRDDPAPPSFFIAMSSDKAFPTSKFKREDMDPNFKISKLTNILKFFREYQTVRSSGSENKLKVDVIAYADPQHDGREPNIEASIRSNHNLAANRANTIRDLISEDGELNPIIKMTTQGKESASLERKYPESNDHYSKGKKVNPLKCDTRRKVVLKTDMNPNDFKTTIGNGKYIPPHAIASPNMRGEIQKSVNAKIKRTLETPQISNLASPELKAIAATESLLSKESGLPDQCKSEPFRSLLTLHVWGLATKMRPPKAGEDYMTSTTSVVTESKENVKDENGDGEVTTTKTKTTTVTEKYEDDRGWKDDGSVNLTVDKYLIKGGIGFHDETEGATLKSSWYDLHRTAIILNEGVRAQLREKLNREPTATELTTELQRVSKEIQTGKDPQKNLIRFINETYSGKNVADPEWKTKLQKKLNEITTKSGSQPNSSADVWSVGGGSVAFQCFDISAALTENLKDKKNTVFFKSGKELRDENQGAKNVKIAFDPSAFIDVKPADGSSFSFRPGVDPSKGVKGAVCQHCGAGIAFNESGVGVDVIDRSLSNGKALGYMKNFTSEVSQAGRWGSLMAPVTYVIPGCADCQCQNYFDKIKECKNPVVTADGVKTCANGVIRINPLEGKSLNPNKPSSIDSRVGVDLPSEKLADACIFTPPTFHTCGVSPTGGAEDYKSPIPDKMLEFFDPYQMAYVNNIRINDIQSKDALLGEIGKRWCSSCFQSGGPLSNKSPRELIEGVKCNSKDRIGIPTGNDAIDCPHLI